MKAASAPSPKATAVSGTGTAVVLGVVLLAAVLGVFAVWFQWGQTRRCLAFFGPEVARQIQAASRVELWRLELAASGLRVAARQDVSAAPGLVHLRRGLIEDVNYHWPYPAAGGEVADRLDPSAWGMALAFWDHDRDLKDSETGPPAAVLALGFDAPASLTVVGRPGRVAMGRLAPGLRKWVDATWE